MRKIPEYTEEQGTFVDSNHREMVAHGTSEFRMKVYRIKVLPENRLALYYHWHDEMELFFLEKGTLIFCLGADEFVLEEGEMVLIPSGVPHAAYRPEGGREPTAYDAVDVHMNFLASQENDLIQRQYILPVFMGWERLPQRITAGMEPHPALCRIFLEIVDLYQTKPLGYELRIKGNLYEMLYQFITLKGQEEQYQYSEIWVKQTLKYIQENFQRKITLPEMAAYVNMSEGYFCRSMKKVFKTSPMEFLNRYRVFQAVHVIESTDRKLIDIAYEMGFCNGNRFTDSFKKYMGCTPMEYRQRLRREKRNVQ